MIRGGLKHLSRVSDVLFRELRVERDITIFPDDVFLTSYPRSGNTWMRFLVGNLLHQEKPVTFLNMERLVPDMYKHSDRKLRHLPRPRILKSHECFDPRYRRVIYIVRDPRDVVVSNYHWEMKQRSMPDAYPIEQFVDGWMEPVYWVRVGSWGDHVTSWLSTRQGRPGFLLLRYEDMIADAKPGVGQGARFSVLSRCRRGWPGPRSSAPRTACASWKKNRETSGWRRGTRGRINHLSARPRLADGAPTFRQSRWR